MTRSCLSIDRAIRFTVQVDLQTYRPVGDKTNSSFFDEYRSKIYSRRAESGLDDLIKTMSAVVIQVDHGAAISYVAELHVMTPYRFDGAFTSPTHRLFVLRNKTTAAAPVLIVIEPLSDQFEDASTRLNMLYPNARKHPNARYIGEIFHTEDLSQTQSLLESHNIRFEYPGDTENPLYTLPTLRFTVPSDFTTNRVGYASINFDDPLALGLGEPLELAPWEWAMLDEPANRAHDLGLPQLVLGLDHLATRVLAGEREDAILEFLTMSPYYFWGAYDIADMNSSTNVTRHPGVVDVKASPAKVFTANNTPSFVNSFEHRPMPTEDFVRNYGRRMHHTAFEVLDGHQTDGQANVDFVVDTLIDEGIDFLAEVVGTCGDEPDLKQIFSTHSPYSVLITEYVERCHGYEGFFTKSNVAALTEAAGHDERYAHGHVFD